MKKRLTRQEEFEIMKLVMDKFLWFGFGIMAWGLLKALAVSVTEGLYYIIAGAVILIIFMLIIVREYEVIAF